MLKILQKKRMMYCLPIWAVLCCGCGKKVAQTKEEAETRAPALSATTVELSNDGSSPQAYPFPDLGEVYIPKNLEFRGGDGKAQTKVVFSGGFPSEEFFCLYGANANREIIKQGQGNANYAFLNCYYEGSLLGYQAGDSVVQTPGQKIVIESSGAKVKALFDIDWH